MTALPRSLRIKSASRRAIISMPPPGANGTTILIGLSGKLASAGDGTIVSNDRHRNETGINAEVSFVMDARIDASPSQLEGHRKSPNPGKIQQAGMRSESL